MVVATILHGFTDLYCSKLSMITNRPLSVDLVDMEKDMNLPGISNREGHGKKSMPWYRWVVASIIVVCWFIASVWHQPAATRPALVYKQKSIGVFEEVIHQALSSFCSQSVQ